MLNEEDPGRRPEKPQTDHHFETPVVREARPIRAAREEPRDGADADGDLSEDPGAATPLRRSSACEF